MKLAFPHNRALGLLDERLSGCNYRAVRRQYDIPVAHLHEANDFM